MRTHRKEIAEVKRSESPSRLSAQRPEQAACAHRHRMLVTMLEPPFDPADKPTAEEVKRETEHVLERDVIHYHAVTDANYTSKWMLYPVNSPERQEVAQRIGHYFHREMGFDFPPYTAGDESADRLVYLVGSKRVPTMVPLIAGAVEFHKVQSDWVLTWIWLHPWERTGELAEMTFDTLDQLHGEFFVESPVSKAMRALMKKRGYKDDRIVRIK